MDLVQITKSYVVLSAILAFASVAAYLPTRDRRYIRWGLLIFLVISAGAFSPTPIIFFTAVFFIILVVTRGRGVVDLLVTYVVLYPLMPVTIEPFITLPVIHVTVSMIYPKLLWIVLLLPLFVKTVAFGNFRGLYWRYDRYIILFLFYSVIILFRDRTALSALGGLFYLFLSFYLPYFLFSREVKSEKDCSSIFSGMAFMGFFLGSVGLFEILSNWKVYSHLVSHLNNIGVRYAYRAGLLRSAGPEGNAIAFGCFLMLIVPAVTYLICKKPAEKINYLFLVFTVVGTASTLTTTPFVAIIVFYLVFVILTVQRRESIVGGVLVTAIAILMLPFSMVFISQSTVDYRQELLLHSMPVIKRSPLTGSGTYMMEEELHLPIGDNSLDLTNNYLYMALRYGLAGLSIYLLIFMSAIYWLWMSIGRSDKPDEKLGGALLLSSVVGILIMMASIAQPTYVYGYLFVFLGLITAYVKSHEI